MMRSLRNVIKYALASICITSINTSQATEIEPRAFSNTPVGLNFLIAGYLYTEGSVSFDPAVPLTDAQLHTNSAILAYARSLNAWGRSAKFDVIVPHTWLEGSAQYTGQPRTRVVSGLADPKPWVSVNFIEAPALSVPRGRFAGVVGSDGFRRAHRDRSVGDSSTLRQARACAETTGAQSS